MTTDKLKARLAELTKERDDYVNQANREIAYFNGRITEIERLINDMQPKEKGQDENGI